MFTDTLPGIVRVAAVPNLATTCGGGPASAVAGGTTVTLANGSTIPSGSCTITVDVTAAAVGTYTNTILADDLKTNTGTNASPASATLVVTAVAPVPTLPEWALIVLAAFLGLGGFLAIHRRRMAD